LVHQELLSLLSIVHFLGVSADEWVEVCVESLWVQNCLLLHILFRSKDPTESLSLLPTRAVVAWYLNDYVSYWQVDRGIAYFGHEDCVDNVGLLERIQNIHSFIVRTLAINEGFLQDACKLL
jgi:hypothetical protein